MTGGCEYLVLGAGVAGLTIGREMAHAGRSVVLIEQDPEVGGLSRTFRRDGYSFDLGGHRFHSNNPGVVGWLHELLGDDLLQVARQSRICLQGRFIDYPIRLPQAMTAFGPVKTAAIAASYLKAASVRNGGPTRSFEDWVVRRFGRALYEIYFRPYTEKVWGIPCASLSADWAEQRITLPSFAQAVYQAVIPSRHPPKTAIREFYYPRTGYGTICDRLADDIVAHGQEIRTSSSLVSLRFGEDGARAAVRHADGSVREISCRHVISTIPVHALLAAMADEADAARELAESRLTYRGLLLIFLVIDRPQVSADSWTYFPDPALLFGRTHEPRNWSAAMAPVGAPTSLALEVFCSPGDPVWQETDRTLIDRASEGLERVGWARPTQIKAAWVLRVPNAYPIYTLDYADQVRKLRDVLGRWPGLSLVGRTGSFRYLNVDGIVEACFSWPLGWVSAIAREFSRWERT